MGNPWLEIPYSDYENHMAEVGQSKVLNELVRNYLKKIKPESFALLGCSTGNGLEHIDLNVTKFVYALDINPDYLNRLNDRFRYLGNALIIIQSDIQKEELPFKQVDLIFAGLLLEYVDVEPALKKMVSSLKKSGTLIILIQKTGDTTFVTKTGYTSLEKLAFLSHEIKEEEIITYLWSLHLSLIEKKEIHLHETKSFICMEFTRSF